MTLAKSLQSIGLVHAAQSIQQIIADGVRDALSTEQLLERVATAEYTARATRSYQRRHRGSHLGSATPLADFDWAHPRHIDRALVEQALSLRFLEEGGAVLFLGRTGTGKTHLAKALVTAALAAGNKAVFVDQLALVNDLARQESTAALDRRLRSYTRPHLLCIDEIAQQHIDTRRLDLLYEVVRRRYDARRAIVITAQPFADWTTVFPSTAATAALIDRLVHRAAIVHIDADSYRHRQAQERTAAGR